MSNGASLSKTSPTLNFDIDIYNAYLVNLFENCADFVSMHYDLSIHESKFWDYVRDTFEPSDYQRLFKDNINSFNAVYDL